MSEAILARAGFKACGHGEKPVGRSRRRRPAEDAARREEAMPLASWRMTLVAGVAAMLLLMSGTALAGGRSAEPLEGFGSVATLLEHVHAAEAPALRVFWPSSGATVH